MKRFIGIMLLLLASFALASCKGGGGEVEDLNPVIEGAVDIAEWVKGVEFDPKAGVTAKDHEGNDLTESIVISGEVDVNEVGTYEITYTVEDKDGRKTEVKIKVTVYKPNGVPSINGAKNLILEVGDPVDLKAGITAEDEEDGDLTSSIKLSVDTVDTSKIGRTKVMYSVTDKDGATGYASITVLVVEDKDALFQGVLNLKFAPSDIKNNFFAAAERYLLETMAGGIPFYVANSFTMFADRVTLPVSSFIPSYGWGTRYAEITKDDSQVKDVEGNFGQAGEYTYRTWNTQTFSTLNFWIYDDSVSSDYLSLLEGSFFRQVLNDARNGWEFAPDLASKGPEPVGDSVKEINGKIVSNSWKVTLRDDLEWAFNENIDTTGFDTKLDVEDFLWTYKEALTQNLFRAISGGGDFVKEVVGAEEYAKKAKEYYGGDTEPTAEQKAELEALWDKVGIKRAVNTEGETPVPENAIIFTLKEAKGEFDAYYLLGWPAMNQDLYEKFGDKYGTDEMHIASSGEYIMTSFEPSKLTRYKKNPKYPHSDETMWTGQDIIIYDKAEVAFQAFLDGKLESSSVPNARIQEFISDSRVRRTPDSTTWRLNLNALKTVEAQQAQFPGSTFVPEPILGYTEFRQALFHILDRKDLQDNWVPTSGIGITHFSSAYYVDPESGIPYRDSEPGKKLSQDMGEDTWGYNKGLALSLLREAVAKGIEEGYYEKGTPQNYTEIKLDVRFMNITQSDATKVRSDFVKQAFEMLVDNDNYVKIVVEIIDTPFPNIYYDYMMTGSFDIAIGGISGSVLNASSFLDVYSSDNRGGFTINWGYDTSIPEIPVTWVHEGEEITKIFSYDAIVTALNGKATIVDGDDVPPVLDEGVYADWEKVLDELEDFFDRYAFPEVEGADFEIKKDEGRIGGAWVLFPEAMTKQDVLDAFEGAGWSFNEASEDWPAELEKSDIFGIFADDLDSEIGQAIATEYGIVAPEGDKVALFIY